MRYDFKSKFVFQVCWGIQDSLWCKYWVLMMSSGIGAQLCLLAKDEGRKGPCPRSSVASVTHTLSCVDWSLRDLGYKMALSPESWGQSSPWRLTLS